METDPAVADSLLNAIPAPRHDRSRALHAILRTQIDYKLYRKAESDSLIRIATDYYGKGSKSYHAAMAWYSLGCVAGEMHEDSTAFMSYLIAKDLFTDTLSRAYCLIEQNLGLHYLKRMMFDEAYGMFVSCAANSQRLDDTATMLFSRYQSGLSRLYAERFEDASSIFQTMLADTVCKPAWRSIYLQMAKLCNQRQDFVSCIDYLESYMHNAAETSTLGAAYSLMGDAYWGVGQPDSAYQFYRKSMECNDELYTQCANSRMLAILSVRKNLNEDAVRYFEKYTLLKDSIGKVENRITLLNLENAHNIELEFQNIKNRHTIILTSVICLSVILLILTLSYIVGMKKKSEFAFVRHQNEILKLQEEISAQKNEFQLSGIRHLEKHIMQMSSDNAQAKKTLLQFHRQRLSDEKELFERTSGFRILLTIMDKSYEEVSRKDINQVANDIANCFSDLISFSHSTFPNISVEDIQLIILSCYHVSNENIGMIIDGLSAEGVRKRKYRLKKEHPDFYSIFENEQ